MEDLIEALQIFFKYQNNYAPTHCKYDVLYVDVDPEIVTIKDHEKLKSLSFLVDKKLEMFYSFRFGSC